MREARSVRGTVPITCCCDKTSYLLPTGLRERGFRVGGTQGKAPGVLARPLTGSVPWELVNSEDAQRCPTVIDPSCNTDQGVRRAYKCDGSKPQRKVKARGGALLP